MIFKRVLSWHKYRTGTTAGVLDKYWLCADIYNTKILLLRGFLKCLENGQIREIQWPRKSRLKGSGTNCAFLAFLCIQLQRSYFLNGAHFPKPHPRACPSSCHGNLDWNQETHNSPGRAWSWQSCLRTRSAPRLVSVPEGPFHWCPRCRMTFSDCV